MADPCNKTTITVHLTPAQLDRLISLAKHQVALAAQNWKGDAELPEIVARLEAARPPCACCGEPATRQSADGVPLCEGDFQHLSEHDVEAVR